MFKIRREQLAVLARDYTGRNLAEQIRARGFAAAWIEQDHEVRVRDARGSTSRLGIDDQGRVDRHTTPAGRVYRYEYTADHQLAGVTDPSGLREALEYDDGLPVAYSRSPGRRWTFGWGPGRNLTRVAGPDRAEIVMTHAGPGAIATYTDRMGHGARFERDKSGRIVALADFAGNRATFAYGAWDRPDRITRADGSTEAIARDPSGRMARVDLNGRPWAQFEYDAAGRVAAVRYADGHFVELDYDADGRVTEARNPSVVVRLAYDGNGRLVREDQGGQVVRYEYDAAGLLTALTTPEGQSLRFAYDEDARLTEAIDWVGGGHAFAPGDDGRSARHEFPNGLVTETRLAIEGDSTEIRTTGPRLGERALALRLEYNVNGQVARLIDREGGTRTFTYDPEGRVLGVQRADGRGGESFAFDANGNRTKVGAEDAEFDTMNRLRCQGSTRLEYDERGNLVVQSGPDGVTRYSYNGQDLLTAADLPDGRRVTFTYDAFARRVSKTVGAVETCYLWAGDRLIAAMTRGGDRVERRDYAFLPYTSEPFALRIDGRVYSYHNDHLGRPRWLTDASGRVAWSADHAAFGAATIAEEAVTNPWRAPGQFRDEETGLHYNRARYYSPTLGRYLTRDPLDLLAGLNPYTYAENDPVNKIDPLGLLGFWGKVAAGAAVVAGAALLVAGAVVLVPAAIAVATGAAVAGPVVLASAGFLLGGGLVGAGIMAGTTPPGGCVPCRAAKGFLMGVEGAMAALGAMFGGAGLAGLAAGAGAVLTTGGVVASTQATAAAGIVIAAASSQMMNQSNRIDEGGGGGEGGGSGGGSGSGGSGGGETPRDEARRTGRELLKRFKREEGVGQGAGRSGGHGTPHKRAGAELIRRGNQFPRNDPRREAYRVEGERLINQGKGHSHR
ncbi:MAG TPA: RHS repeat-associated core domain-containing protein [Isosphaeraceae bacterium]|jgi:RHS repeat-associated protein